MVAAALDPATMSPAIASPFLRLKNEAPENNMLTTSSSIGIIGIDLGVKNIGIAYLNGTIHHTYLLREETTLRNKIAKLYEYLDHLPAGIIAYESTVLRAMNGRIMDQLSGAVEAYALIRNIPCLAISPTTVRKSLLGKGNKKKEDIQVFIKARFNTSCSSSHHELDALAVALCAQNLA